MTYRNYLAYIWHVFFALHSLNILSIIVDLDADHVIHDGGRVHRFVAIAPRCHPNDANADGNERKWLPNYFYLTWSPLLSVQGQLRCFGVGTHSKNATSHQAHQPSLPSLPILRAKWHNQNISDRECEPNSQYFNEALTSEWLSTSQKETFEMVRNEIMIPFREWIS